MTISTWVKPYGIDSAWEKAAFKFTAYNDVGESPDAQITLGTLEFKKHLAALERIINNKP